MKIDINATEQRRLLTALDLQHAQQKRAINTEPNEAIKELRAKEQQETAALRSKIANMTEALK